MADTQAAFYSDLDTFFTAWAGVARRSKKRPRADRAALEQATHSLPFEAAFTEKRDRVHASAAPERERAAYRRPAARARLRRRRGQPARRHGAEHAAGRILRRRSRTFAQNPIVRSASKTSRRRCRSAPRCSPGSRPSRRYCNYLTLTFRNVASLQAENIGVGTLARAGVVLAPNGPNNEGFPSSAPANGPSIEKALRQHRGHRQQPRARQPLPERRRPRPAAGCAKPATRRTCRASRCSATLPAARGANNRELTTPRTEPVRRKVPEPRRSRTRPRRCEATKGKKQMSRVRWWRRHDEIPVVELQPLQPGALRGRVPAWSS